MDNLNSQDFQALASFIQDFTGIRMPAGKKTMLEGRLRKRVRALGLGSLDEYCHLLFRDGLMEAERTSLVNAVTTNKTDFLREAEHFNLLRQQILPQWMDGPERIGISRPLRTWSAACSSGAEPYTLAMLFDDISLSARQIRHEILATDISTEILDKAKRAIYPAEMLAPVPPDWQKRYFLRSRQTASPTVRLVPKIRQAVHFGYLNLMEPQYPLPNSMDLIFCRNILIYFNKQTQQQVLSRLCRHLRPGGVLFISHTESVAGMDLPVHPLTTSVFVRR